MTTDNEAIRIAREEYDGAYICEASQEPLRLADFIDVDGMFEQADESATDEHGGEDGDAIFEVDAAQRESLTAAVKAAVETWQTGAGLTFLPRMFTCVRNEEYIEAPDDAAHRVGGE